MQGPLSLLPLVVMFLYIGVRIHLNCVCPDTPLLYQLIYFIIVCPHVVSGAMLLCSGDFYLIRKYGVHGPTCTSSFLTGLITGVNAIILLYNLYCWVQDYSLGNTIKEIILIGLAVILVLLMLVVPTTTIWGEALVCILVMGFCVLGIYALLLNMGDIEIDPNLRPGIVASSKDEEAITTWVIILCVCISLFIVGVGAFCYI